MVKSLRVSVQHAKYIIAAIVFSTLLLSCNNTSNNRIVYEIPETYREEIDKQLKLLDLGKVVVFTEIDSSGSDEVALCFQKVSDARMNEFYQYKPLP